MESPLSVIKKVDFKNKDYLKKFNLKDKRVEIKSGAKIFKGEERSIERGLNLFVEINKDNEQILTQQYYA